MILYDFICDCGNGFEALVEAGAAQEACPECGKQATRIMSVPHVGVLLNNPERLGESLKKRSQEHSLQEAKKNVEKFASKMGGSPRAQSKWNLRSSKSS